MFEPEMKDSNSNVKACPCLSTQRGSRERNRDTVGEQGGPHTEGSPWTHGRQMPVREDREETSASLVVQRNRVLLSWRGPGPLPQAPQCALQSLGSYWPLRLSL